MGGLQRKGRYNPLLIIGSHFMRSQAFNFFVLNKPTQLPVKKIEQISLYGYPNIDACFDLLKKAGAEYFALFGGAIRDADYAARHQVACNIKDFDLRIWLPNNDYELQVKEFLNKLFELTGVAINEVPSPGTNKIRYCFVYEGVELDISIRPIPILFQHSKPSAEAVAVDRAQSGDIGLCAIAIDPLKRAWAKPEYLQDQMNKTLSVFPNENKEQQKVYTERMLKKFPGHQVIMLSHDEEIKPKAPYSAP